MPWPRRFESSTDAEDALEEAPEDAADAEDASEDTQMPKMPKEGVTKYNQAAQVSFSKF